MNRFERRNPGATPHDLETAKCFATMVTRACKGRIATAATIVRHDGTAIKALTLSYVIYKYKIFIGGWPRRPGNYKISPEVTQSVTNVRIVSLFGHPFSPTLC